MTADSPPVRGVVAAAAPITTAAAAQDARRSWIPVAYPTLIGGGFFLSLFVASGASPFATTRLIVGSVVLCLVVSVVCCALMRDRDRGGLVALAVILLLIAGNSPVRFAALAVGIGALAFERVASRGRPTRVPWRLVSRIGNMAGVIVLLAVTIRAGQDGTLAALADDVRAEGPGFLRPAAASVAP
ncbi:MAG TPA: hypothetical protein VKA85_08565, partial [Candidatus Limnocylindrales bacterium]|nr:hypothetical protein [Candidatus Limnocylindrales bacterium]